MNHSAGVEKRIKKKNTKKVVEEGGEGTSPPIDHAQTISDFRSKWQQDQEEHLMFEAEENRMVRSQEFLAQAIEARKSFDVERMLQIKDLYDDILDQLTDEAEMQFKLLVQDLVD